MKPVLLAAAVVVLASSSVAGQTRAGQTQAQRFPDINRPVFLSGRVLLEDGTPPPEQVLVQRSCDGRAIPQGYTDSKGQFSFELGRNPALALDAQNQIYEAEGGTGLRDLTGCELRVQLPGFYPTARDLGGRRLLDSPDVGTLVLRPLPGVRGSIFSPTTMQARKDAREAFEKGRALGRDKKLDEARKEYEKAIRIAPGFAAAWFELGLVQQMLNHLGEARTAYGEALLADPRFIKPYRQLAFLSFNEQKWQEVVEMTDRWTSLDSVSYPEAYFFNAFANLYLNRLDAAERSAREAVKLDSAGSIPRARYVLGGVLIEKKDYAGAAEQLRTYVETAEPGPDVERAKQMLAQLEAKVGGRPAP